jgi:hypothetical protein
LDFESYRTRLDQIGLDFTIFVSDLVRSNESDQIEFLSDTYLSHAGFTLISIELNSFSCFALQDQFLTVKRAIGSVFMFCAPRLIFDCTEGVRSCFHVLRSRTHF